MTPPMTPPVHGGGETGISAGQMSPMAFPGHLPQSSQATPRFDNANVQAHQHAWMAAYSQYYDQMVAAHSNATAISPRTIPRTPPPEIQDRQLQTPMANSKDGHFAVS